MNPKKPRTPCRNCGKEPYRAFYTYCSNVCQQEYQSQKLIREWKSGERTGLQTIGIVATYVKKYLRAKYKNKCCLCGWSKVNHKTGLVPLVADHIDGNWKNNTENNLRLLCPNCDSLTPTFAALNKGNGRRNRAPRKRSQEGREFLREFRGVRKVKVLPFSV